MNLEQYVRSGYSLYLDFANAVAAILESALAAANPPFHIQYIQRRAKAIESLAHKIPNRERLDPEHIEHDIKDLAGCRLIFYTNSEVDRFNASGILRANFTVDYTRTKVHHPVPGQNASEFRSTNVVLSLTEDRVKLPEYERFKGLFCEVQVQTILNHAWADTAHAVTYKRPNLQGVGEKQLKLIDDRLTRIMNDFLLPAGYEFQKVWEDYERVLKGKELIDLGAGDDLATRPNNNDRQNLLKGIRDYLLPALDDPHSQYPELQKKITASVSIARKSKPQPIEVPGGQFDGVTIEQYLDLVLEILSDYRYADIEGTFDAICELYLGAETEPERQKVLGVAEKLAEHQLDVWQQAGPYIQGLLIARISALPSEERRRLGPIIATIARNVLSSNVTGTRSTYNKITISTGAVAPSEALSNIRKDTIKLLISLYAETTGEQERRVIIHALLEATRTPSQVQASDALLAEILSDTADIIDFFTSLVPTEIFEVLQKIEHAVLLRHRWNVDIAKDRSAGDPVLAQFSRQEASVTRFRAAVDASSEFIVFKTLVGYDSVFPPAWSDYDFEVRGEDDYRAERIDEYVADISASNSEDWFKIIERCAQSVSNDGATFRFFHLFLDRFGERKPRVALTLLSKMTTTVAPFLPPLLSGLAKSEEKSQPKRKLTSG